MVTLIAEVASNHGGDLALAERFIRETHAAGADVVKFQLTRAKRLAQDDPQRAWFEAVEWSPAQWREVVGTCWDVGITPLLTVFHAEDVPELVELGLTMVKVGSGEAHEIGLAQAIAAQPTLTRTIVSCGITEPWLAPFPRAEYLRCICRYPAPPVQHGAYGTREWYQGWSDHSVGLDACKTAMLAGATIIEKHVNVPDGPRTFQPWDVTPDAFMALRRFADEQPERFKGRWQHAAA